jgi:hypothetical protein
MLGSVAAVAVPWHRHVLLPLQLQLLSTSAAAAGVAEDVDIFAAAAALAADKALAAEALSVEYVPQASFLSEGQELLQQAKDEMEALAAAVSQAQVI